MHLLRSVYSCVLTDLQARLRVHLSADAAEAHARGARRLRVRDGLRDGSGTLVPDAPPPHLVLNDAEESVTLASLRQRLSPPLGP